MPATIQQFVEDVNAALLSARNSQTGEYRGMSNAKPPSKVRLAFGRRLATIREAAGFETATAFADALGMSIATYSRYERGETEPGIETIQKMQALTGVSLDFLIGGRVDRTGFADSPPKNGTGTA